MTLPNFTYVRPKSLADALGHLRSPKAVIHAGGTDLLGCLRDGVFGTEKLVSIGYLDKLKGINRTPEGGVRIGALTLIADLAASALIQQSYPALARGAAEVGSPQLRNQGTLGGNLCQKPRCWYYRGEFICLRKGGDKCYAYDGENQYHCILGGSICFITHPSDIAPSLVVYDAVIRVAGAKGFREVPAGKFHILPEESVEKETVLTPDEIVTEVFLPILVVQTELGAKPMANWIFNSSQLFRNIVQLEFKLETEPTRVMSVTVPLENANRLAAGVINALRAAEQQGSQIPPIDLGNEQTMSIDELVVDQWRVTESPELAGRCFLHLLTMEGLYLGIIYLSPLPKETPDFGG